MPAPEELLRDELKRVADTVQPGQLRPLQVPVPGRRWHRGCSRSPPRPRSSPSPWLRCWWPGPSPALPRRRARPPYRATTSRLPTSQTRRTMGRPQLPVTEAVVRDSASGRITGTVKIVTDVFPAPVTVAAAPDDRSFIIGTVLSLIPRAPRPRVTRNTASSGCPISADGKPGHLTELPAYPVPMYALVEGIALSPDGTLLAVSSDVQRPPGGLPPAVLYEGRGHRPGHREGPDLDRRHPAGSLLRARPAVLGRRRPDDRVHLAAQPEPDQRQHDDGGSPPARYRRARRQPGGFPDDRLAKGGQRHHPERADHPRRA